MSDEMRENRNEENPRYQRSDRPERPARDMEERTGRGGYKAKTAKRKVCRFCAGEAVVDYKNTRVLKSFITERFKIVPARITGTCARHQRALTTAVKRARSLALIPYTSCHGF